MKCYEGRFPFPLHSRWLSPHSHHDFGFVICRYLPVLSTVGARRNQEKSRFLRYGNNNSLIIINNNNSLVESTNNQTLLISPISFCCCMSGRTNQFRPSARNKLHRAVYLISIPDGSTLHFILVVILLIHRGVPPFPSLWQHIILQDPSFRNRP